jgi:hypothetical protein
MDWAAFVRYTEIDGTFRKQKRIPYTNADETGIFIIAVIVPTYWADPFVAIRSS